MYATYVCHVSRMYVTPCPKLALAHALSAREHAQGCASPGMASHFVFAPALTRADACPLLARPQEIYIGAAVPPGLTFARAPSFGRTASTQMGRTASTASNASASLKRTPSNASTSASINRLAISQSVSAPSDRAPSAPLIFWRRPSAFAALEVERAPRKRVSEALSTYRHSAPLVGSLPRVFNNTRDGRK